jgi:hypothetical protein
LGVGRWELRVAALLLVCAASAGCGKKGPPLTPFVRVPAVVEGLAARRVGADVYVTLTVPSVNIDGSAPAAVQRIDVYGVTSLTPPPRARVLQIATLVETIPVAPAADPADPTAVVPVSDPAAGARQGAVVTIRDTLAAEAFVPRELPALDEDRPAVALAGAGTPRPTALRRFYMAIPFSARARSGPPSTIVEMPLTILPDRPAAVRAAYGEFDLSVQWDPSGGLIGWLMERVLAPETPPFVQVAPPPATVPVPTSDLPPGPTLYHVYREMAPDPLALPASPAGAAAGWGAPPPAPITPKPLAALAYTEPLMLDERERCYHVRAVRGSIESEPSPRVCVVPIDTFPPATPTGLATIASEGAISLIWEPNVEADLGGYVVLRREASGDTLLPLMDAPIRQTRFVDTRVAPGVQYVYAVVAVDSRVPVPNMSPRSAEVADTAP